MNSSLLRVDWYSFMVGTQISSIVGILTTSEYLGIRIRFAREYLYPTVNNNGNTLFIFRIKETGNWLRNGWKLLCKIFEKNMIGGLAYILVEQHVASKVPENVVRASICGGIIGIFSYFSFNNYDIRLTQPTHVWQIILCCLVSTEISAVLEEVKMLVSLEHLVNFNVALPYTSLTFFNGAVVGSLVGIRCSSFLDVLDEIVLPEVNDTDTNWNAFKKYLRFISDVSCCVVSFTFCIKEKILAGGIVHCMFEYLTQSVTGWKASHLTGIVSGWFHAVYLGLETGRGLKVMKLSLFVTSFIRIIPGLFSHLRNVAFPIVIAK